MSVALEIQDLTMCFGGLTAVDRFSLKINEGELVGVIGPNGAGKTTVFNMVTGIYVPTSGTIKLHGKDITGARAAHITEAGICRTFQNIRLFKDLSVLDNIRLAGHSRLKYGILSSIFKTKKYREEEAALYEQAMELLKVFKLDHKAQTIAKNLPYGEQRRLEIARALATKPKVLLLDEPAAGMNPQETRELTDLIKWVQEHFKIAVLLIEHDMGLVMKVCERIYVLDYGKGIAHGAPSEIQNNPKVIEAYLGSETPDDQVVKRDVPINTTLQAPILQVKDLDVHYGNIHALHGVNLEVYPGEIVTILGANGAGKTTTLKTLSGLLKPTRGEVRFGGDIIHVLPAHQITARGIAQSPEGRMVFPAHSVFENLEMGAYLRRDKDIDSDLELMFKLFPRLKERRKQMAGTLSGGEQQMLAIARAYMARPKLLLLDEPSLGIAPILVQAIFDAIVELNRTQNMTILLVEQNAYAALKIADRAYVMATGNIVRQGPASELLADEAIQKAYLGH